MEIQYQNSREDFGAYYELLWRERKDFQRTEYYHSLLWYLAVLGLATYIAAKHHEVFAICVFGALALFYIKQNWSFANHWSAQIRAYADTVPETASRLVLGDQGVTEQFSGVELQVPWSEIHGYNFEEERLFIHFLKHRAFIIPCRHLSVDQRDELIRLLEKYHVKQRS
jgi:hypothetical protein